MVNIKMDFVADFHEIMINEMTDSGLIFSSNTPMDTLVIKYFTYLRKKGQSRPRRIHRSNEFVCPPDLQNGLNRLIQKLEKGHDISPYFSKKVDNITKVDGMFNDWGVLHLHLGEEPMPADPRYINRTGPLLFLYLKDDDAYLINIYEHGDWTDKSILQTVQDNWPELLKPFVLKGVWGLGSQYTKEQHAQLREKGLSVLVELVGEDGGRIVVGPPGGGIVTSKDSMLDVRSYDFKIRRIRNIEKFVFTSSDLFNKAFHGKVPDPLHLKLILEEKEWKIIEQKTGMKFEFIKE